MGSKPLDLIPLDKSKSGTLDLIPLGMEPAAGPPPPPSTLGFIKNLGTSTANLVGNVAGAVMHPVQTFQGMGKIAAGAVEAAAPETFGSTDIPAFHAVLNQFKDRYGGWDKLLKTAYEDPVGVAADASTVLGGAGSITKAVGAAKVGKAISTASTVLDPLQVAGQAASKAGLGKLVASLAATTTGTTPFAMRRAFSEHTRDFTAALHGKITAQDILQNLRDSVQQVVDKRGADYRSKLAQIKEIQTPLDLSPIAENAARRLEEFGVKLDSTSDLETIARKLGRGYTADSLAAMNPEMLKGLIETANSIKGKSKLDFSQSVITARRDQAQVMQTMQDIQGWKDLTPAGVDRLKRRVMDRYSEGSNARAFIEGTYKDIRNELDTRVPGYKEMTGPYHEATEFLNQIKSEIGGKGDGTAIRRLQTATGANNELRQALLEALDTKTGSRLMDQVAGYTLRDIAPHGLMRTVAGGAILYGLMHGIEPLKVLELALTSPRAMGQIMSISGAATRSGAGKLLTPIGRVSAYSGPPPAPE